MPNGASVGAGGIGTLSLLALFPPARAEIAQRYFTLDISDETANGVLYYGLACIILCGLPFNLLGILGTRQGRSLTMGRGARAPKYLAQTKVKVGLPPMFR